MGLRIFRVFVLTDLGLFVCSYVAVFSAVSGLELSMAKEHHQCMCTFYFRSSLSFRTLHLLYVNCEPTYTLLCEIICLYKVCGM